MVNISEEIVMDKTSSFFCTDPIHPTGTCRVARTSRLFRDLEERSGYLLSIRSNKDKSGFTSIKKKGEIL